MNSLQKKGLLSGENVYAILRPVKIFVTVQLHSNISALLLNLYHNKQVSVDSEIFFAAFFK